MLKTHFVQVAISHGTTVPGMVYWSVWSMDHRYSRSETAPAFDFGYAPIFNGIALRNAEAVR